jgi:Dehydrogenases with different specificities (related to short-chain alcohol dehydrogenases)
MTTRSIHQFAEKVALITDGSNPVGMATAIQLALNGSYVVVGRPNGVASSIAEIESLGTLSMAVDWETNESGAEALIEAVREKFGRLDLLVTCLTGQNADRIDGTISLHLSSVCHLIDDACRLMIDRPKPRIVNVVSACDSGRSDTVFAATQAGIVGLTRALAKSLPKNFRVNAVSISDEMAPSQGFDVELVRPQPVVSPDDAARSILFLLSGESTSVNGQVVSLA